MESIMKNRSSKLFKRIKNNLKIQKSGRVWIENGQLFVEGFENAIASVKKWDYRSESSQGWISYSFDKHCDVFQDGKKWFWQMNLSSNDSAGPYRFNFYNGDFVSSVGFDSEVEALCSLAVGFSIIEQLSFANKNTFYKYGPLLKDFSNIKIPEPVDSKKWIIESNIRTSKLDSIIWLLNNDY